MVATEARLNQLYNRATQVLGADEAETMMEVMRSSVRGDLVTTAHLESTTILLQADLHRATADLRAELRGEIQSVAADLRTELHGVAADLRTELHGVAAELRTELHGVAAELRTELHDVEQRMTKTFVTWLIACQAANAAIVGALFSVAT